MFPYNHEMQTLQANVYSLPSSNFGRYSLSFKHACHHVNLHCPIDIGSLRCIIKPGTRLGFLIYCIKRLQVIRMIENTCSVNDRNEISISWTFARKKWNFGTPGLRHLIWHTTIQRIMLISQLGTV